MGRFWSILFLLVPVLGVAVFVAAMADIGIYNHWLPENLNEHGAIIDNLFLFILYLTGVIFVATGIVLFWFLWKYDAERYSEPAKFTHGSHTLEVVWSILPAAALLFIAIYQMNAWANEKMRRPVDPGRDGIVGTSDDPMDAGPDGVFGTPDDAPRPKPPTVEVTGRQFEWRIRYPGADGVIGTFDDIHTVNELHVPVNEEIVVQIKSDDVLHSFFLPNMRVKQDVVPGMTQFVWFHPNKTGKYDIVCAELCGWGHYKMRGRLTIESREKFDRWLADTYAQQEQSEFTPAAGE